jgi:hypothetical protein|tara:strand:+ start:123 stop:434 length:312 start_codon:yes stop_codon:yes gene_type:complete
MAKELNEDTSFKLSIKTLIGIGFAIATLAGMWFTLQSDIAEAKELPANEWNPEWIEKLPPDEVTRMEFQMKDEMIRNTIMNTQSDVTEIKESLEKIEDKLYNR